MMTHDEFIYDFLANHPLAIFAEAESAWQAYEMRQIDKSHDADAFPNK